MLEQCGPQLGRPHVDTLAGSAHANMKEIRMKGQGASIGPNDAMIASHVLAMDAVLVTNNTRHFSRVDELAVENWLDR